MSALTTLIQAGQASLDQVGMPTRRVEAYKYSDLSAFDLPTASFDRSTLELDLPETDALWAGWIAEAPATMAAALGSLLPVADPIAALNSAKTQDVFVIGVLGGQKIAEPLRLTFKSNGNTAPRVLVLVEDEAEVTLIETYVGDGQIVPAVEVLVGKGAQVDHIRTQVMADTALHLGLTGVSIAQDARYSHFALNKGSKLSRHNIRVSLADTGSHVDLYGLHLIGDQQHCDTASYIDHAAARTTSNEVYKSVVSGNANSVFQGKIYVAKDSQKIEGNQMSRGLLLGPRAKINNKPELEIYADDVICSHGSTVGALEDEAIFYLRARGIPEAQARRIMVEAFVKEVLESDEAPETLDQCWREQLDGFFASLSEA